MRLILLFLLAAHTLFSQSRQPALFRWQDQHARKHLKKYIVHDTLMATSAATLHISYNTKPGKPYLLMLHGMGANARTNWSSQIGPLSKRFNLILPDLIYFGESSSSSQNYSVEFQAQQIHEALMSLGIADSLHVMGFSYGGLCAAMYNELYQPSVKKLIIIDGLVKFFSARMADSLAKVVGVAGMNNVVTPVTIEGFNGMKQAVMSSWFPAGKSFKRKIITYFFLPTKATRDLQMSYLVANETHYRSYSYNINKTPTLLIWGAKDGVIPLSVGKALHAAYPATTRLLVFRKAKHDAHFKERRALNKAVIAFLEGQ